MNPDYQGYYGGSALQTGGSNKRKKLLAIVVILSVLLIAVVMAAVLTSRNSQQDQARKIADNFVQLVVEGKVEESYSQFSQLTKSRMTFGEWASTVAGLDGFFENYEHLKTSAYDDYTIVEYVALGLDGEYLLSLSIEKNGGVMTINSRPYFREIEGDQEE